MAAMDCNKEEATRAKKLAEEKMRAGDFVAAHKLVTTAQRLFPELENILKMIAVCDVHSSADKKIKGLDNWYGILQVQPFADADTIRKQYRKLALLLHPDKNKFSGAEAAFKLVGEANRWLSDQIKRSQYDVRYRSHSLFASSRSNANSGRHCSSVSNAAENIASGHTFWTGCKNCGHRYKYLKPYMNQLMHCASCHNSYIACNMEYDRVPHTSSTASVKQFQHQEMHNTSRQNAATGTGSGSSAAEMDKDGTVVGKLNKRHQETQKRGAGDRKPKKDEGCTEDDAEGGKPQNGETVTNNSAEISKTDVLKPEPVVKEPETSAAAEMDKNGIVRRKFNKRNQENQKRGAGDKKLMKDEGCTENDAEGGRPQKGAEIPKPHILKPEAEVKEPETSAAKSVPDLSSPKKNQAAKKTRKAVQESSMSFEVDGSNVAGDKTDTNEYNNRKSSRKKPQVYYGERRGDGDFVIPPTKKTKSGCEFESVFNIKQTDEDNKSPGLADSGVFPASSHPNTLDIPAPEFNVFEDERKPENFAVNQVWSTCDPRDGMPRRYARVKKVMASEFKLRITYLEPVREKNDESIPIAWGMFKNGGTAEIENRSIFSGQMLHSSCNRFVSIYPKKGEIWAMFRDWNKEWNTTLGKHKLPYKYDFVEIVSDFKQEDGIGVAYLGKTKGFVSLFHREAHNGVCQIQFTVEEMLRFSHKVPAVKMTGEEKDCVPADSYELDPTALPKYIFQVDAVNMEMDSETLKGKADGPHPETPKIEVKANPVPKVAPSPRKRRKSDDDGGCSNHDKVCSTSVSLREVIGGTSRTSDVSSCLVNEKSRPNESRKSREASDGFKLRKSPRLQTNPSQQRDEKKSSKQGDTMNTPKPTDKYLVEDTLGIKKSPKGIQRQVESQVGEGSKKRGCNGKLLSRSKQNGLPVQLDGFTNESLQKISVSSSCKTPQRNAFDFKNERSEDKFRVSQIWAVYSNDKGMPTEYVRIESIQKKPEFVLYVTHMELYPPPTEPVTHPVSCGDFKLETGKPKILPRASFSHQVRPIDSKKKIVKVYPRKGEIWALHKNCDSTEEEHDIVEVVEGYCESDSVKVVALTAKGSSSLYIKQRKHGSTAGLLDIPKAEMSRFSHQIPAVGHEKRTTRLVEGGYWELDPVAIPGRTIVID